MAHPLADAWAKVGWARKHLETLDQQIGVWTTGNNYVIDYYRNAEGTVHTWKAQLVGEEMPAQDWALMAGDCVHNARAALDYITFYLSGSNLADARIQFPIFKSLAAFNYRNRGEGMIAPINDTRMRARLRWLQPYRRRDPDRDSLWVLHALDIADKHKLLSVIWTNVSRFVVRSRGNPATRGQWTINRGAIHDGAVIARIVNVDPPEMNMQANITLSVSFAQGVPGGSDRIVTETLSNICDRVERVIALFER